MKPNQRGRFNNRHNNSSRGSSRPQMIFRNTSLESTGPCGKLRGTALQLHEKYLMAAKDALIQNDDILAETCFQYADHYMHLQNQAIANEQALHAQHQAQQPVPEVTPITETTESPETLPEQPISESPKVIDVSVPVAEMNRQSETGLPTSAPKRRVLRPRATPRTPDSQTPSES